MIRTFENEIMNGIIMMDRENDERNQLTQKNYKNLIAILSQKNSNTAEVTIDAIKSVPTLLKGKEMIYNAFKNKIFSANSDSIKLYESSQIK